MQKPLLCLLILILPVVAFAQGAPGGGTIYWASPSGSGSSCSQSNPCSFATALSNAGNTDEIVLKDGTYNKFGRHETVNAGVLIRAENKHGAILFNTDPADVHGNDVFRILHNNMTVRGLHLLDDREGGVGFSIRANDFLVEHNLISDTGSSCLDMSNDARGGIIRWNTIRNCGYTPRPDGTSGFGREGMNLGGYDGGDSDTGDTEIYANTVDDYAFHPMEHKDLSSEFNIHHNIFENGRSGAMWIRGWDNLFQNNIFRNGSSFDLYDVHEDANNIVTNNVTYNISGGGRAIRIRGYNGKFPATTASQVINNTFCNTEDSVESSSGLISSPNTFNAAQSVCDAEETRILNEMDNLPGKNYNGAAALSAPLNLRIQ